MFVILTYDVNFKRVTKVMKICRKYLYHEQRSVFEGDITEGHLNHLKDELKALINVEEDNVSIYEFQTMKYSCKERLGAIAEERNIL